MAKGLKSIKALKRASPITGSIGTTVSPSGTTVAIPEAGLEIEFPAGAVSKPATFSLVVLADHVGFSASLSAALERPAIVRQAVGTNSDVLLIGGGAVDLDGVITAPESARKMSYDHASKTAQAEVLHFSGYMVALGFTMEPCDPTVITDGSCVWYDF